MTNAETNEAKQEENPAEIEGLPGDWRGYSPTIGDRLLSALAWTAGSAWLLPTTTAMQLAHKTVGARAIDKFSKMFCSGMVKTATFSSYHAHVHPGITLAEQYIFAQNHTNHFDFVAMYPATQHYLQGLELETHFKYPVYGSFMKSRGTIPVPADRTARFEAVREGIRSKVEEGASILAFPEGSRTLNGRVGEFKKGIFMTARDLGLKVVPTSVTGMYDVMRKGSLLIRPFKRIDVWLDEPIDFANLSDADVTERMQWVRTAIARRVDDYFDGERST